MQYEPDEPKWTWTQIWIQVRMPDYSLNGTIRSSAIQGGKRCQCCNSPTRRGPSRSRGLFGLESAIGFDTRPAQMPDSTQKNLCAKIIRATRRIYFFGIGGFPFHISRKYFSKIFIYRDSYTWRSNQRPEIAEPKLYN